MVSVKTWRMEPLLQLLVRLVLSFAVGALGASLVRRWLGSQAMEEAWLPLIISIVCLHGAALVVIALFIRDQETGWADAFGFKNQTGWAVLLGVCVGIIVLPVCWWLQSVMVQGLSQLGFDVAEQSAIKLLRDADTIWKQAVLGLFAVVIAPVAEELFFRGIAYPMLKQRVHPQFALWSTAVLFALIHGNIVIVVPLIVLAVALTLLYEWTDNLLACIVVHSLFNAANFGMLMLSKWRLPLHHP